MTHTMRWARTLVSIEPSDECQKRTTSSPEKKMVHVDVKRVKRTRSRSERLRWLCSMLNFDVSHADSASCGAIHVSQTWVCEEADAPR